MTQKGTGMRITHRLKGVLLLGALTVIGSASAAWAHAGGAEGQNITIPMIFSLLLGGLAYLFMVWDIPKLFVDILKGRAQLTVTVEAPLRPTQF